MRRYAAVERQDAARTRGLRRPSELVPLLVAVLVLELVRRPRELFGLHAHLSRPLLQLTEPLATLERRLQQSIIHHDAAI